MTNRTAKPLASGQAWPVDLAFDREARVLRIAYDDGASFAIGFELLRVESPSAEVQGHAGRKAIVRDKGDVSVKDAFPVGRYAVRIVFDDGHETGIYSWAYLRKLGEEHDALLAAYRASL
jgi:DUF971 family protein